MNVLSRFREQQTDRNREPTWTRETFDKMEDEIAKEVKAQQFAPRPMTLEEKWNEYAAVNAEHASVCLLADDLAKRSCELHAEILADLEIEAVKVETRRLQIDRLKGALDKGLPEPKPQTTEEIKS